MEFPDLGEHCFEKSCNRLDFLPMKCDACSNIFCKDHIQYANHSCDKSYQKDVQVPVCPLCNKPVPSKRGEPPDIAVGQHIDSDCMSDPAVNNRKIYTNKCSVKGCKQKELIPVTCSSCRRNYCLKHRHTADHNCQGIKADGKSLSPAGAAALARVQNIKNQASNRSCGMFARQTPAGKQMSQTPESNLSHYQPGMSEDEALALAMEKSLIESNCDQPLPKEVQERQDRLLAEALAASEQQNAADHRHQRKDKNCIVS